MGTDRLAVDEQDALAIAPGGVQQIVHAIAAGDLQGEVDCQHLESFNP